MEFQVGDVMIRDHPERFPSGAARKLQSHSAGPFKFLKRISPNAYVLDLPFDYGISSNVTDLSAYKSPVFIPPPGPFNNPSPPPVGMPIPTPNPLLIPTAPQDCKGEHEWGLRFTCHPTRSNRVAFFET